MCTPAPPSSLTLTFLAAAASAIRWASAIGSSCGLVTWAARSPSSLRRDLDHDGLEIGHLLEREPAADAPDAALLAGSTAEGQVRLPVVRGLVDVDPACLERIRETKRARQVPGVHGSQKPVRRVVGQP